MGALGLAPAVCAAELLHRDTDTEGGVSGGEVGWGGERLGQWPGMRVGGRGVRERKRKLAKCRIGVSHLLNLL